jgi:hypothetical protein
MEITLLAAGVFFLAVCDITLTFINANLKEVVKLVWQIAEYQRAANPLPPKLPQYLKEP